MKTHAYAQAHAYPNEDGQVPNVMVPLLTGQPQSRRGKEKLKKAFLDGLELLLNAQGNPRLADFRERDEEDWILVHAGSYVYGDQRMVVYELHERS